MAIKQRLVKKSKLGLDERLHVYRKTYNKLEYMRASDNIEYGLCGCFNDVLEDMGIDFHVHDVKKLFPEVWNHKPATVIGDYHFWFPLDHAGILTRMRIIRSVIKEVNLKLGK